MNETIRKIVKIYIQFIAAFFLPFSPYLLAKFNSVAIKDSFSSSTIWSPLSLSLSQKVS